MSNKKPTFQCAAYMGEEAVNIYCQDERIIDLLNKGSFIPFIPEWHISDNEAEKGATLVCDFSQKFSIKAEKNREFLICGSFSDLASASTIPYFVHYILEAERAVKGKSTIHAAAVSKDNKGILILGKQGSGKTSIALELCRKYGYSLIGNDLVLAGFKNGVGYLYGGTKIFRLRATTIKHYNKDFKKFFQQNLNRDEWTNTIIIGPAEIGIATEKQVVPIQAIYYIHLYSPHHDFFASAVDALLSKIYLYQIFSEYIKGAAIIPLVGKNLHYGGYLPSLDTETFFNSRIKFIEWIIAHQSFKYIAGQMSDICSFIDRRL